jgi:hypothetical protein
MIAVRTIAVWTIAVWMIAGACSRASAPRAAAPSTAERSVDRESVPATYAPAPPVDAPLRPAPTIDAPLRPAPTVVAGGRHEPKHLVADATGATWVEVADDVSTVWDVARGGTPAKLATVRGEITMLALDPHGGLFAGIRRGDSFTVARLRGGKAEPFLTFDGYAEAIAVDDGAVYVGGGGAFERIDRKTHAKKKLADNVEYSYADKMAVDATSVYWSNELDDTPKRIYRVPKTGGDVEQVSSTAVGVWTLADNGPVLVSDDVAEAAYAGAITWGLTDSAIVVLAP